MRVGVGWGGQQRSGLPRGLQRAALSQTHELALQRTELGLSLVVGYPGVTVAEV